MNHQNLRILADYLAALPKDYTHFDMGVYFFSNGHDLVEGEQLYATEPSYLTHCGTVACALGHGPAAGIPAAATEDDGIDWDEYVQTALGLSFANDRPTWLWLFASEWTYHDNTPHGAAARIYYLLDGKSIPTMTGSYAKHLELYRDYLP